jgi:hypothetical protein
VPDAAGFCGIILLIITGSVLGAVDSSVSANSRSLRTGDLPQGESHGVIDVRSVLERMACSTAPRGSRMSVSTVSLPSFLVSLLLSRLLFGEAME